MPIKKWASVFDQEHGAAMESGLQAAAAVLADKLPVMIAHNAWVGEGRGVLSLSVGVPAHDRKLRQAVPNVRLTGRE
jgi:hypothetical protein